MCVHYNNENEVCLHIRKSFYVNYFLIPGTSAPFNQFFETLSSQREAASSK